MGQNCPFWWGFFFFLISPYPFLIVVNEHGNSRESREDILKRHEYPAQCLEDLTDEKDKPLLTLIRV